jgi:HSP20 family protein
VVKVFGPLVEMARLQNEINKIFESVLDLSPEESLKAASGWVPSVDVIQSAESIIVTAELPGVDVTSLSLEVGSGQIVIRGEKPSTPAVTNARHHCVERTHGSFQRTVALPVPVNTHRATARLHEGLLTVTFPRVQNRRGEDISIVIETE